MAMVPRGFGNSIFDPFFGTSIFDPFDNFFDRAFNNFTSFPRDVSSVASTRVDWVETPEAHVFKADLPGMRKEEIKVQVINDGVLSISGERGKEEVNERDNYRRVERSYGKFSRQFKLPSNAKAQEISAKVDNGVLTVTVPKTEATKETSRLRDIQISS